MDAEGQDMINQDWWPDYPSYTEALNQWPDAAGSDMPGQGELIQSDLFGLTGNTLHESESTITEDPNLFNFVDLNVPTLDSDNIWVAAATDSLASGCASEGSLPGTSISKRGKSKKICPATLDPPATLNPPSAASLLKKPECRPESEICPVGKTAMCCTGERQGWDKFSGFSVGNCMKCTFVLSSSSAFGDRLPLLLP